MNIICLSAFVTLIVVVVADHSQHGAVTKPGDVVHWTTSNSKGAATLNSTSHAKQEFGAKAAVTTTTTAAAAAAETTVTTVAVPATAAVNATKPADATPVAATPVAAAPVAAAPVAAGPKLTKEAAEATTITVTSTTPAAAAPEAKEAKPTQPKAHK